MIQDKVLLHPSPRWTLTSLMLASQQSCINSRQLSLLSRSDIRTCRTEKIAKCSKLMRIRSAYWLITHSKMQQSISQVQDCVYLRSNPSTELALLWTPTQSILKALHRPLWPPSTRLKNQSWHLSNTIAMCRHTNSVRFKISHRHSWPDWRKTQNWPQSTARICAWGLPLQIRLRKNTPVLVKPQTNSTWTERAM